MEVDVTAFRLKQTVDYGDKFRIGYKLLTPSPPQFAINLIDDIHHNIILHFNPRYLADDAKNNKQLILNNCINGKWQQEVRYDITDDLRGKHGEEQEITIEVQHRGAFVITAPSPLGFVYEFAVRNSVSTCTKIEITCGGSFTSFVHQKPTVDYRDVVMQNFGK